MKKVSVLFCLMVVLVAFLMWAPLAPARSNYYTTLCAGCHVGVSSTCDGCHAHGVHSDSSKTDLNVTGVTDKAAYSPGETVSVTINGGYGRGGWVRAILYDQNMVELARSSGPGGLGGGASFPITLSAPAPTAAGTYTWNVSWYGNQYDIVSAYFGPRWTPDPGNANHGQEIVFTNAFTVIPPTVPDINLSPASLNFGNVTIGGSVTLPAQVQNLGTADLNITGIALCAGTSTEFTWSPAAPFTVAPGGSQTLSVIYTPVSAGTDTGCLAISSNDPDESVVNLNLTGTGVPPVTISDYDITGFRCTHRASVGDTVTLKVVIKNQSLTSDLGAPLTVSGNQGGTVIPIVTDTTVYDPVGDGRTTYTFTYTVAASGNIMWTATLADEDSDIDQAFCTTIVP